MYKKYFYSSVLITVTSLTLNSCGDLVTRKSDFSNSEVSQESSKMTDSRVEASQSEASQSEASQDNLSVVHHESKDLQPLLDNLNYANLGQRERTFLNILEKQLPAMYDKIREESSSKKQITSENKTLFLKIKTKFNLISENLKKFNKTTDETERNKIIQEIKYFYEIAQIYYHEFYKLPKIDRNRKIKLELANKLKKMEQLSLDIERKTRFYVSVIKIRHLFAFANIYYNQLKKEMDKNPYTAINLEEPEVKRAMSKLRNIHFDIESLHEKISLSPNS